jgi:hypothetical protein
VIFRVYVYLPEGKVQDEKMCFDRHPQGGQSNPSNTNTDRASHLLSAIRYEEL